MHINGEAITERDFNAFLTAVPEQQRPMFAAPEGRRMLANEVVRMKALEQEGKRMGMDSDPQLVAQLALLRSQVTAQRTLEKIVNEKAEGQIRAEYEKSKGETKTLRHIVIGFQGSMVPPRNQKVLSPEQALAKTKDLIAKIRGGADFGAIAKAESDDLETANRNGTLGPLTGGQLPPEIESVVSKLQPGQVSEPIRTQLGYHIFALGQPTLEDMRPVLLQRVQQQIAQDEVKKLEAKAKVEYDPTFFPPEKPAPNPAMNPTVTPQGSPQGTPAPRPKG
jgi:parvulin-like peptidyl-prolyl isomerase